MVSLRWFLEGRPSADPIPPSPPDPPLSRPLSRDSGESVVSHSNHLSRGRFYFPSIAKRNFVLVVHPSTDGTSTVQRGRPKLSFYGWTTSTEFFVTTHTFIIVDGFVRNSYPVPDPVGIRGVSQKCWCEPP